MAMERAILRIKRQDRKRNAKTRMESKAKDCRYIAKKMKVGYAGHAVRRWEDRWEKRTVDWTSREGKRRVGRPKTRSEDEIINYGGVAWRKDARDRKRWANVGEAYALGWAHSGR